MTTVSYQKLVRDRIPQIIEHSGEVPHVRVAEVSEMRVLLHAKLKEEVAEYLTDGDEHELADILEVISALCAMHGVTMQDVETWRIAKAVERGGFDGRKVLESVDEDV